MGPASQQDVEMSALYHDAVIAYGDGKVLGILATKTSDHEIRKRAAEDDKSSSTTTPISLVEPDIPDEIKREDFIYYPKDGTYKILLHTHSPPRLVNGSSVTVLSDKVTTTTNRRNQISQTLKLRYVSMPGQVRAI